MKYLVYALIGIVVMVVQMLIIMFILGLLNIHLPVHVLAGILLLFWVISIPVFLDMKSRKSR